MPPKVATACIVVNVYICGYARGLALLSAAGFHGPVGVPVGWTLRYAKIANHTVADEEFAATEKVDALYAQARQLPADTLGPNMTRLSGEHDRLLGNGLCNRPNNLECAFDCICESCTFFTTSIEFRPTLQAQNDDAHTKGQPLSDTYQALLATITESEAS